MDEKLDKYLEKIITYLSKMVLFSYELACQNPKELAGAVYFISLKTLEQAAKNIDP